MDNCKGDRSDRSDLQVFAIFETHTWICDDPWEKYNLELQVHDLQVFSGRLPCIDLQITRTRGMP